MSMGIRPILLAAIVCTLCCGQPASAQRKKPAAKPAQAPKKAAIPPEKVDGLFSLAGQAGLPAYLKCDQKALGNTKGIQGGEIRTIDTDFFKKDFTLDVVFQIPTDVERPAAVVGIGENGRDGGWHINSLGVELAGRDKGVAKIIQHRASKQAELGKYGDERGPHLFRMEKKGNTLTFVLSAKFDGKTVNFDFVKTIPDFENSTPYLNRINSGLFISGNLTFMSVRLAVDGKVVDPGSPAHVALKPIADDAGWTKLGSGLSTPDYWSPNPKATVDQEGLDLRHTVVKTIAGDFLTKDFTFDVMYKFRPDEEGAFVLGIGENGRDSGNWVKNSFVTKIHGPGRENGLLSTTFYSFAYQTKYGNTGKDHAGPHVVRMQKCGDTLMFAVCVNYKDKFIPDFISVAPSLKSQTPYLHEKNTHIFMGEGGTFQAMRLIVDGKPVAGPQAAPAVASATPGAGPATRGAATPGAVTPGAVTPSAATPGALTAGPLFSLAGQAGLPKYLKIDDKAYADAQGLRGGEIRSTANDLATRDFVVDLLFQPNPEQGDFRAGLGVAGTERDRDRLPNAVYFRATDPSRSAKADILIGTANTVPLGAISGAGPHLLRIDKRGRALTFSLHLNYKGTFTPTLVRTVPDLAGSAPFLNTTNGGLFVTGGATLLSAALSVDGRPLDPGTPANKGFADVTGPENLLKLGGVRRLPDFFLPNRDVILMPDGINLNGKKIRTRDAGFNARNFTFDVAFRYTNKDHDSSVVVGIGEGVIPEHQYKIPNSLYARLRFNDRDKKITFGNRGQDPHQETKWATFGEQNATQMLRLQKRNDVLTLAICPDYKGKFEPAETRTFPSLRGAAPYLTSRNGSLFILGAGVTIEQVRLVTEATPADSGVIVLEIPSRVGEGTPLQKPVAKVVAGRQFAAVNAPAGLAVTPAGQITWTPTEAQVGIHRFEVQVAEKGVTTVLPVEIEVVAKRDVAAAGGDLAKVDLLYKVPLESEHHQIVPGFDRKSLLLLEGNQLRRIGADGLSVLQTLELPKQYRWIGERQNYFAALSDVNKSLDLIDKTTLKVTRAIQMLYSRRYDLALHPHLPVCYVTAERAVNDEAMPMIVVVNEQTGDVIEPDCPGTWVVVSPDGRYLYAGYKDIYQKGDRLLFNPGRIDVVPEYGSIDMLLVYDISRRTPVEVTGHSSAGANGQGLVLSPDGKRLSYLSFVGYPQYTKNIPAWDTTDFRKRPISYPAKDNNADCKIAAYHPTLPIIAAAKDGGAVCFDVETAEVQPDRLDLYGLTPDMKVKGLVFSPDGRYLLLDVDQQGQRFLRQVPLKLSPAEAVRAKTPLPQVPPAQAPAPPVKPAAGGPQKV